MVWILFQNPGKNSAGIVDAVCPQAFDGLVEQVVDRWRSGGCLTDRRSGHRTIFYSIRFA